MNGWELPVSTQLNGRNYSFYSDYRDILEIIGYLEDRSLPEFMRWRIALALFYKEKVRQSDLRAAADYLGAFIAGGRPRETPGPKLLDWEQDADVIVSDVNKVAGFEIRGVRYLHWWTFLGYFHAIGEGQLSGLVAIRDKLRRGKPLEKWEQTYYRENRERVELKQRYTAWEKAEQARLKALLKENE